VKIDNSGHVVMLEKSDEVNAAILPFLEKVS
jgi:pimeloyl-ACP methyl ester carboxylesterase